MAVSKSLSSEEMVNLVEKVVITSSNGLVNTLVINEENWSRMMSCKKQTFWAVVQQTMVAAYLYDDI